MKGWLTYRGNSYSCGSVCWEVDIESSYVVLGFDDAEADEDGEGRDGGDSPMR